MAPLSFTVLPLLLAVLSSATPLHDPHVNEFLARDPAVTLPLAARASTGRQTRHLRPEAYIPAHFEKRDSITGPDVGQPASFLDGQPEPVRGPYGATFLGGSNTAIDLENEAYVAGPTTDAGTVANLKWSMSLSHTRLLKGGWVREQLISDLPPSKDFAAAEIRLAPNAYRELHWHRVAEWGYVLGGSARIAAIDNEGRNYEADLVGPGNGTEGGIYSFPAGVPHSIQALGDGVEILLVFSDGNFESTGTTFMLSDWLVHTPLDVVAQNFGVNASTLANMPAKDPYVFGSTVAPPPLGQGAATMPQDPAGQVKNPYAFNVANQPKLNAPGGYMKIQTADTNFPVSTMFASAFVHVAPGAMREMHWHTTDEWVYILHGQGRATAFQGGSSSRTFDFQTGDTAVFPVGFGHYMQNTSPNVTLSYIEMWKTTTFVDFSATQWLALMPPQVVADLLNITVAEVETFKKTKQYIVA